MTREERRKQIEDWEDYCATERRKLAFRDAAKWHSLSHLASKLFSQETDHA